MAVETALWLVQLQRVTAVTVNPVQVGVPVTFRSHNIVFDSFLVFAKFLLHWNFHLSAVNGMYGTWSLWSECDRTCGGGSRVRSRSCTNPPAQFGGSDCSALGPTEETELCNLNSCPGKSRADSGFFLFLNEKKDLNLLLLEWTLWAILFR